MCLATYLNEEIKHKRNLKFQRFENSNVFNLFSAANSAERNLSCLIVVI